MNKPLIAAVLAAAAVAIPAFALRQGGPPGGPGRHMAPQTRAEVIARVQERFAQVDANHDGAVTRAEFDAFRGRMQAEREAKRAERRAELFARLDTNKDGQISRAEFDARPTPGADDMRGGRGMRGHGGMAMHGHGGMGAWGGWGGPNGDKRAEAFFAAMDANKDGRVTLAEATAKPLAMFDKADANHDGTLSPDERRDARDAMRAAWRGKRD